MIKLKKKIKCNKMYRDEIEKKTLEIIKNKANIYQKNKDQN